MKAADHSRALTHAWLLLVGLTLFSLGLGEWARQWPWLPALVAGIVWFKGMVVALCFIEISPAHPFIRRVVLAFIAIPPLALLATAYYGETLARWAAL